MKKKVAVALSGGVDSSVVALLLQQQGYDVTGIHLKQWTDAEDDDKDLFNDRPKPATCCTLEDQLNVQRLGRQLGFPVLILNYREFFKRAVVDYFVSEYGELRTPNPCVVCNRAVRFGEFLRHVQEAGFDYLATGHYVQNVCSKQEGKKPQYQLHRGADKRKDQSYFLYTLNQERLQHLLFPLGHMSKPAVRQLAYDHSLPTAAARESQEVSFIVGDYRTFLQRQIGDSLKPGVIVTVEGEEIGQHQGLPLYTVGQRKGLHTTKNIPLYVKELDGARNALVVGQRAQTRRQSCRLTELTWVAGHRPESDSLMVQLRHHGQPVAARLVDDQLEFSEAQDAVSPGQSAVFYDQQTCLGGGIINL